MGRSEVEVFVVEASSFQLGRSSTFRPAVGTWLNFAEDHLDVHESAASYRGRQVAGSSTCAPGAWRWRTPTIRS
ncbi:MAG: Mur ligase family protein [Acidimicrobiia bacterium]|nr:Mur ligase family protein [Acidimicrobiia bacterium]